MERINSDITLPRGVDLVAVGITFTSEPPHRSVCAALPRTAPILGIWRKSERSDMDAVSLVLESIDRLWDQTSPSSCDDAGSFGIELGTNISLSP